MHCMQVVLVVVETDRRTRVEVVELVKRIFGELGNINLRSQRKGEESWSLTRVKVLWPG